MMAHPIARGDAQRNGHNGHAHGAAAPAAVAERDEEALRREVQRLTAENQHLLGMLAGDSGAGPELERLRKENGDLRTSVAEMEQLLESGEGRNSQEWAERQREYEALLEEKSEVIRGLHQKMQDLRQQLEQVGAAPEPVLSDGPVTERDLQTLKAELVRQREQLEEDEESLMTQMRQMEMGMARERAELARQRAELQRLGNDLKHEIEQASRDGALRERLQHLQRRQPTEGGAKGEGPVRPSDPTPNPKSSGVLRRLFGPGQNS
jgi:hypothetical protein